MTDSKLHVRLLNTKIFTFIPCFWCLLSFAAHQHRVGHIVPTEERGNRTENKDRYEPATCWYESQLLVMVVCFSYSVWMLTVGPFRLLLTIGECPFGCPFDLPCRLSWYAGSQGSYFNTGNYTELPSRVFPRKKGINMRFHMKTACHCFGLIYQFIFVFMTRLIQLQNDNWHVLVMFPS